MKRRGKIVLIIGCLCIAIGGIGMMVGQHAGAKTILENSLRGTFNFSFNRDNNNDEKSKQSQSALSEEETDGWRNEHRKEHGRETVCKQKTNQIASANIQKIDLQMKTRNIIIKSGDVESISYEGILDTDEIKVDQEKLKIEDHSKLLKNVNKNVTLEIIIPNRLIHEIEVENKTGDVTLQGIETNELSLELGVGDIELEEVTIHSETEIKGGTGNIQVKDSTFYSKFDIEEGAGDIAFIGELMGNVKINCGIGDVKLEVDNHRDNYHIVAEGGVNSLKIDGEKMGGSLATQYNDNYENNRFDMKLEVGVGDVQVNFNDQKPILR